MEKNEEALQADSIASKSLFLFLLIVFGLAWSLVALFVFAPDWVVGALGKLSGRHPLFILAVYAPAIAALLLMGLTAGWMAREGVRDHSGHHPLFILAINAPAIASLLLIGFPAYSQDSMTNSW